jgi:hypothetical protein
MAPRSPGRPKAAYPRDVRVTGRLTEEEVDQLQRYLGRTTRRTLADTIRSCTFQYLAMLQSMSRDLPDTTHAQMQRARRAARRAAGQERTPEARAATGAIATALTEQGEILRDHAGV